MRPTSQPISFLLLLSVVLFTACGSSRKTTSRQSVVIITPSRSVKDIPKKILPYRENDLKRKYATILAVDPRHIRDTALYAFIERWYGTPYQYGGNGFSGVDCSGLVQQLYQWVYGIQLPRTSAAQFQESKHFIQEKKLQEGDLVFFQTVGDKVSHVGVYLQNGYFVHSSVSGVVINNLQEEFWQRCFVAGGRH